MAYENKELATIKKPNQIEYITKEEYDWRLKEIAKCKRDIIYFCETYFRITNLDKGLHIVKLYDIQKEFINFMKDNNRVICCSGRQQGKSSCYCMYILWLTMFFPDKSVMILAQKESTALEILKKIKDGYLYLPSWLKPSCTEMNKKSMTFGNRSVTHGFASSSDGCRGTSASILVLDEFSFVAPGIADKLFTSVYPVVSSAKDGKVIIVSTPNGTNNLFYKIWKQATAKEAKKNLDGWKPFQMWWWQVPGHDEKWKEAQIASIGKEKFEQEFNNSFVDGSSYKKLISDEKIEQFRRKISEWKEKNQNQGKDLFINSKDKSKTYTFKMYHEFNPSHTYIASGDCGEGIGGDSSVLYVWDITYTSNIKLCMKFADNRIPLIEFAYVTNEILKLYANPFLAVESNGIGVGYIEQSRMVYNYENLVRLNREGGYGIQSHSTVKSKACLWLKEMMDTEGFGFEIYDKELVEEMPTFIKKDTVKNDIFAALGDNHDDFIMSFIWMAWMLNEENLEKYFIVTDWFISKVGKQLPQTIQPLGEYKYKDIVAISNDPVYRDFMEFKKMMQEKYQNMIDIEREKSGMDVFQMEKLQNMSNSQIMEIKKQRANYNQGGGCLFSCGGGFHDESGYYDDWGGGSWN